MTPQRITMITLAVRDLDRSREFYAKLGWQEAGGGNDIIAFYEIAGQYFSLYHQDALSKDLARQIPTHATGSVTLAINYMSKKDVDEVFATALAAGADAITKPDEVFWGGYSGNFTDPDGHLWEVAYNPFWALDDCGQIVHKP